MLDIERLSELAGEVGEEDLDMVLNLFLDEAEEVIERISKRMEDEDFAKATHFLRSGALNIGFSGLASAAGAADDLPPDRRGEAAASLTAVLLETRRVVGSTVGFAA
ncbi:Hpt domain-containing protein [Jannaschia aquimarina]|uniref:HPt domain-containing protein n=2 Tax=Jannaschia aquimarina TaxID=935700 RepID=A0A0D1DAQ2_9RHOB|nr:Hpt domain-containing protein [Jannaschia aquimarina]KIT17018.1 hypothetical protein jaqu_12080 [Jannaschia aquimarina]SNS81586.1 hypothetical protein SAMN05421775_102411 [Jannaschia aquimarina]